MSETITVPVPEDIPGLRDLLLIIPTDEEAYQTVLFKLASLLFARAESNGSTEDYNDGTKALREFVELAGPNDPTLEDRLQLLDRILEIQFNKTNATADINAWVEARGKAVRKFPSGHPSRPKYLHGFGRKLLLRAQRTSSKPDVHTAIKILEEALSLVPEDQFDHLPYIESLGHAVQELWDYTNSASDLDYLLQLRQKAVELTTRHDRAIPGHAINNLAAVYYSRYEVTGTMMDLNNTLHTTQEAINLLPQGDRARCKFLANLGYCYERKFEHTGVRSDLDAAVKAFNEAAEIAPMDLEKSSFEHDVSMALWLRYEVTGSLQDLQVAITALEETSKSLPLDHPKRVSRVHDLGLAYARLAESNGSSLLLDKAIQALKESPINGPDKSQNTTLVAALVVRYGLCGNEVDFAAAKELSLELLETDAMTLTSQSKNATNETQRMNIKDSAFHSFHLNNLAKLYHYRFDKMKRPEDIEEVVRLGNLAVQFVPAHDIHRGSFLKGLGDAFRDRYRLTGSTDLGDLLSAVKNYEESVDCIESAATARIAAAIQGGKLAASTYPRRAYDLLSKATKLLSLASPRAFSRDDQQLALSKSSGVASDAAALCVSCGEPVEVALKLLELGRGVMISSRLETRSDVTDLEGKHQDLAARFKRNRDRCDGQQNRKAETLSISETADRYEPSLEFDEIIKIIRSQTGFESFLMGISVAEMMSLASGGPIVYINASGYGSDSFIITSDSIQHVPLKDLKYEDLQEYANMLTKLIGNDSPMMRKNNNAAMNKILEWLWDVAIEPTLEKLGFTAVLGTKDAWPHVWWVPVGLLTLFPLHAAGYHASGGRRTLDRIISSYVPTISALKYAQEKAIKLDSTDHNEMLLLAVMTDTPNQDSLEYAALEAASIDHLLPTSVSRVILTSPTKHQIVQKMQQSSAIHLACHGEPNRNPSESKILLADWETDPFSVAEMASLKLDHVRFAYLSACHAASNFNFGLLDEAIHMAGACQLAGFPTVIGTLWQVLDKVSASLAESLYGTLLTDGGIIDFRRAARALHFAIREELEQASPIVWAPYIHIGV
jgi:tetratricopeptide (TPR) repeat protein